MVKYCGYVMRDEWLIQRAVDLGHPRPVTVGDRMDMLLMASDDLRIATNVYPYTKLRRVKNSKGTKFWCIAFAANDPLLERMPTSAPPEEIYKGLKEVLQKTGPPGWYQAS
ncbi:hypothetical protein DFJ58DRAFT_845752 [Suillus subalutaceus]|uniref:uncharacterized protein n=1 Tax=Suillus subalutaceus TaxID=48586 RepID=UPI001B879620|nr:uncharacterized protein DFJ58DRAFT_845752 [Suillus subalutaceus]KAG1839331.1 hypothetical protein DFJ58DRAFT_845752 [Suillus subalutaceus]